MDNLQAAVSWFASLEKQGFFILYFPKKHTFKRKLDNKIKPANVSNNNYYNFASGGDDMNATCKKFYIGFREKSNLKRLFSNKIRATNASGAGRIFRR